MLRQLFRPLALLKAPQKMSFNRFGYTFNTTTKRTAPYNRKNQPKEEGVGSIIIRNDHLKFDADKYDMIMYPFHPEVTKKANNNFEINKNSAVLALSFIEKTPDSGDYVERIKQNWQNRKSISFRFHELSNFLLVNLNETGTWVIVTDRSYKDQKKVKSLTLKNQKGSGFLNIILEEENGQKLETKMSHLEFVLFQVLLKESLVDLSGVKLMFDIKRNEELAKIGEKDKSSVDKESLFKDYDNKEDLV